CDKRTGACTCKRLVTGENCDQCLPEHFGLGDEPDGCKACECDPGGAFDNKCDITTGQCRCREHFGGRKCDTPDSGYFCANIDYYTYEAERANVTGGEIELREVPQNLRERTWTGLGFVRVRSGSQMVFKVSDLVQSMDYNLVLRFDSYRDQVGWENVQVIVVRPDNPSQGSPCYNAIDASGDFLSARLPPGGRYAEVRPAVCLEQGVEYEIRVIFGEKQTGYQDRSASILIDSLVVAPPTEALSVFKGSSLSDYHRTEYERYQCRNMALSLTPISDLSPKCKYYLCPVAAVMLDRGIGCNCDPTGTISGICDVYGGQCECKVNVGGRRCDQCNPGTYGFGPSGCSMCECDSVGALDNFCDGQSGQCKCRERGITGRQCNQCQPGFWGFPDCRVCQCNDHASICDQKTGACIECRDLTSGHYCDRCQDGYYGDPRLGVNIPCKPCPCPGGPASGYQHADTCYLQPGQQPGTQNVVCNCRAGYEGERCASCSINYWGNPSEIGGSCERCDCNGNIDFAVPNSCDAKTGACLLCLHNTEGVQCEHCVAGHFGDAKIRSCQRCVCNHLGTNSSAGECDRVSGQCPCLPNVIGLQCDQCAANHYDLASGKGCSACACDVNGVIPD
uniref:Uncharacterized protein n=1 Tax=Plectus sambesii TaxID=2011161 RepID=A0A914ULJ9_9BILA